MRFTPTDIEGVTLVTIERHRDVRGSFARTFCAREFAAAGLPSSFVQWSTSFNLRAHTLRGMHWQRAPHADAKLVRCTRGAIYDVVADVREDSPTRGRHQAFTLRADGDDMLFIPGGVAHGFMTLEDNTEVHYAMDVPFAPECATGFRYDDPAFGIAWPCAPAVVSDKDLAWALLGH